MLVVITTGDMDYRSYNCCIAIAILIAIIKAYNMW